MLYKYYGVYYLNTPSTLAGSSWIHETRVFFVFLLNL
uniref:Uncharacterized protein n=1 Tax=Podoviridae sp. ctZkC8 TaxID=2825259 RepID=A0A8S5UBY5_9CAUD|nr:MAG TPA: hypothetical protein [Podoviridae sp. ctZkC8]